MACLTPFQDSINPQPNAPVFEERTWPLVLLRHSGNTGVTSIASPVASYFPLRTILMAFLSGYAAIFSRFWGRDLCCSDTFFKSL